MPVTPDEFRAAMSRFPSGITVVTSIDSSGALHGITVSAFCSASLEPPLILVCIEKTTGSHGAIAESKNFVVNFLGAKKDMLSEQFSLRTADKFAGIGISKSTVGIPVLDDAHVILECSLHNACDAGDHSIFIGQVEQVTIREEMPLVYFQGRYRDLLDL